MARDEELVSAISGGNHKKAVEIVNALLERGESADLVFEDSLVPAFRQAEKAFKEAEKAAKQPRKDALSLLLEGPYQGNLLIALRAYAASVQILKPHLGKRASFQVEAFDALSAQLVAQAGAAPHWHGPIHDRDYDQEKPKY